MFSLCGAVGRAYFALTPVFAGIVVCAHISFTWGRFMCGFFCSYLLLRELKMVTVKFSIARGCCGFVMAATLATAGASGASSGAPADDGARMAMACR